METKLNHLYALHFHRLGLNVACISNMVTEYNFYEKNILKTPCHYWGKLKINKQTQSEIDILPWDKSTGVAIIAGYNNFHAIDIDGCTNYQFILDVLKILKLPFDYEWISKSGSQHGYHIYFYSDKLENHGITDAVSSFPSNYENELLFEKIELLWNVPIVVPPSIHITSNRYSFINCKIPQKPPLFIDINRFKIIESLFLNKIKNTYVDYVINRSETLVQPSDIEQVDLKKIKGDLFLIFDIISSSTISISQISWLVMDEEGIIHKKEFRFLNETGPSNIPSILKSPAEEVYRDFINDLKYCEYVISHDLENKLKILYSEIECQNIFFNPDKLKKICMASVRNSSLIDLYKYIFGYKIQDIDNSETSSLVILKCFREYFKYKFFR